MDIPDESRMSVKRRRRHSLQFKAQVLQETQQPGTSVAGVAQRHNLNANLIHKWRRVASSELTTMPVTPTFVPLAPPSSSRSCQPELRIEIPGHQGTVKLFWPCDQPRSLAELLKHLS